MGESFDIFEIAGIMGGCLLLLFAVVAYVISRRIARREQKDKSSEISSFENNAPHITDLELPQESFSSGHDSDDEVDPVAEAEIYLAYGRDTQAEEILREALTKRPDDHRVKLMLLKLYCDRKDAKSFNEILEMIRTSTGGTGEIWEKAIKLDPTLMDSSLSIDFESSGDGLIPKTSSDPGEVIEFTDSPPVQAHIEETVVAFTDVLLTLKNLIDQRNFGKVTVEVKQNAQVGSKEYIITINLK